MYYRIYRNLVNKRLSIMSLPSRLVLGYADEISLYDVRFVVLPGGKKRALETGVRNVHAFVEGKLSAAPGISIRNKDLPLVISSSCHLDNSFKESFRIYYRPFDNVGFVDEKGLPITSVSHLIVNKFGTMLGFN